VIELVLQIHGALGAESGLVLVGGAVRDRLLGRGVEDWDLASALLPEIVMERARRAGLKVFPTGIQHGTVTVMAGGHAFEITTFRGDGIYLDGRHPESVRLGVALEEDLARRDFTINAMALPVEAVEASDWRDRVLDPFQGRRDLAAALIRAVGDPLSRFAEDGLRPLRACRFASQLGFRVEAATLAAIPQRLDVARKVAVERVLVEMTKLLTGPGADLGLDLLRNSGLLEIWFPELLPLVDCAQGHHHRWDAWAHTLATVRAVPAEGPLRWAALLHDVGKPETRTLDDAGEVHFYGHEGRSLEIAQCVLQRLRGSRALAEGVCSLIRHHGIHPTPEWSDAACRRLLGRLEGDHLSLETWGAFRLGDQRAKGWGEEACLGEHLRVMERLQRLAEARPPLNAKALALDGRALMKLLDRPGGPWLGQLQSHLLERLLEEPGQNTPEALGAWVQEWAQSDSGD